MKVLLLSPYDAPSHRRWRLGLAQHLQGVDFTPLVLPPRHFSWRARGNSLSYAFGGDPALDGDYDLLLATSMTDLSALRGMAPRLTRLPTIVYFHENQFAYPMPDSTDRARADPTADPVADPGARREGWLEARMLNLYTALSSNLVLFNSGYNLRTFVDGVADLLALMPDHVPGNICEIIEERSRVIPVPLEQACYLRGEKDETLTIVWNHRWEYDKGPARLLNLMKELLARHLDFRVHLLGQRFRSEPDEMQRVVEMLQQAGRLGHCGYVEDARKYRQLLSASHLVLSTAVHEFQGLAVLEAVAAGCVPVLPARVVYPELFGEDYLYACANGSDSEIDEARAAADKIVAWQASSQTSLAEGTVSAPDVQRFSWERLKVDYRQVFEEVAAGEIP